MYETARRLKLAESLLDPSFSVVLRQLLAHADGKNVPRFSPAARRP